MILLHACCGPCSFIPVKHLKEADIPFKALFYNPNIHPLQEYLARREAMTKVAKLLDFDIIFEDDYDLEGFLFEVSFEPKQPKRCEVCYYLRLSKTAKKARELGFSAISTTLLYSPFQFHGLIKDIGEEVAKKEGLSFYYKDFRPYYYEGKKLAVESGIYRQKYCGCIFSEKERFIKRLQKIEKRFKV